MKSFYALLLVLTMLAFGCNSTQEEPSTDRSLRYLALGDSYTIGTAIDSAGRWPVQLTDSLSALGYNVTETRIIATNGWTTDELHAGIAEENPATHYDLVSLLIGVNNQYRSYDIENYQIEFRELLMHAVDYAGSDTSSVFVLSIPDYGITPFAKERDPERISLEIDQYNKIAKDICAEYGIPFVDITPISRLAAQDGLLLASDSLHPSAFMYSSWVSRTLPVVREILSEQSKQ